MWIYKMTKELRNRAGSRKPSCRKTDIPELKGFKAQGDGDFLENKNVIISGEFFPASENALKENLLESKANVQSQMTPETEILICGKFPDCMLIEEAKMNGLKIIFVDKTSDLFSRFATNIRNSESPLHQVPLGI